MDASRATSEGPFKPKAIERGRFNDKAAKTQTDYSEKCFLTLGRAVTLTLFLRPDPPVRSPQDRIFLLFFSSQSLFTLSHVLSSGQLNFSAAFHSRFYIIWLTKERLIVGTISPFITNIVYQRSNFAGQIFLRLIISLDDSRLFIYSRIHWNLRSSWNWLWDCTPLWSPLRSEPRCILRSAHLTCKRQISVVWGQRQ